MSGPERHRPTVPGSIAEAARLLRSRELSSAELTAAVLARADELDPLLGTYLSRFDAPAMAAAEQADRELAGGTDRGPLHGIPLGIKDILATVEGPTTAQSLVLDRRWGAGKDAPVVARLRAAGAVVTGKTTTMEFAIGSPDPAKPFPWPRNPWDPATWPGGSSSGTATGVAAGLFLGGLGTDTGGSIRIPSAFCGVTGLMPTYGRVPKSGCVPLGYSLDHVGPMARTARDCGVMLAAMAGHHPSDPDSVDRPGPDMAGQLRSSLAGLRIGVVREGHFPDGTDPAVAPAFAAAVGVLGGLGATLVEAALPLYAEMMAVNAVTMLAEALAYHRSTLGPRWGDYGSPTRLFLAQGAFVAGADVVRAQQVLRAVQRRLADTFAAVDLVVMPTLSLGAPRYDQLDRMDDLFGLMHTPYWNPAGHPVLAVPMGFNDGGLPLSLQLASPPFTEPLLVAVGDAFQGVTDWHRRVPPLVTGWAGGGAVPSAAGLPGPPAGPLPPASPPSDAAVGATSLLLSRAGIHATGDELVHLAARYPGITAMIELLYRLDLGDD